jgi:regulator of replication initiation timing
MGTQMGYFQNFRKRKKDGRMQAIADLHLLEASNLSPEKPQMKQWVLSMAAEAPDFIMSSIVFSPSGYFQKHSNGKKKKMEMDGSNYDSELGAVYVDFGAEGKHFYTDLVEAGAATTSLFSNEVNTHLFIVKAENFIADNPEIKKFIADNPDRVQEFLQALGIQPKKSLTMSIKNFLFGTDKPENDVTISAAEVTELREKMTALEEKFAGIESENTALKTKVTETETALATATADVAKFKKEAEKAKEDARKLHVDGPKGFDTEKKDTASELAINKKAAAIQAGRKAV